VPWPVHGRSAWPDAATGWTHAAYLTALLVAVTGVEALVRWLRKR
jgi:hypothetical protein